jgi:hypothetical protein
MNDEILPCAIAVEGGLAPGVLVPGVAYRVAEVRSTDPPSHTVIRFDPIEMTGHLHHDIVTAEDGRRFCWLCAMDERLRAK